MSFSPEVSAKLQSVRTVMAGHGLGAVRLRGVDWFAWITGGGGGHVNLNGEAGVAEALITDRGAWILTNAIEAARLREEEIGPGWKLIAAPWQDTDELEHHVLTEAHGRVVVSDRPRGSEGGLPVEILAAKRRLIEPELVRYRQLGRETAEAMTDVMQAARPTMTEQELAGEGARALWSRGIDAALILVAGASRVDRYRHPLPKAVPIGDRAMMVFCGRRHGLYANLTRQVRFGAVTQDDHRALNDLARIEAAAWERSRPGTTLDLVYHSIAQAYEVTGHRAEINHHHQGGTSGYLSREVIADPHTAIPIEDGTALAWNPSLPGYKMEDTVVTTARGIEILTADPRWPTFEAHGRARPFLLQR